MTTFSQRVKNIFEKKLKAQEGLTSDEEETNAQAAIDAKLAVAKTKASARSGQAVEDRTPEENAAIDKKLLSAKAAADKKRETAAQVAKIMAKKNEGVQKQARIKLDKEKTEVGATASNQSDDPRRSPSLSTMHNSPEGQTRRKAKIKASENIDDPREPYKRGGENEKEIGKAKSIDPRKRTPEQQANYERLRKKYQKARGGMDKPLQRRTEGKDWIGKAADSIEDRGTEGKCTPITKPGCTGRAKALAKTFKKIGRKRDKAIVSKEGK